MTPASPPRRPELGFYVDALSEPQNSGGWPRGGTTRLDIPNRHLEYVLTWYGLALTLVAVFAGSPSQGCGPHGTATGKVKDPSLVPRRPNG